jgi:hypothetical protein
VKAVALALPVVLAASGCASAQSSGFGFQPTPLPLVTIERECDVRGHLFYMTDGGELKIMPHPEERYEAVNCAMTALQKSKFSQNMKIGFVGNAQPAKEEQK